MLACAEDFERYDAGQIIQEIPGWTFDGSRELESAATISQAQSVSGNNALEVSGMADVKHVGASITGVQFFDLYVLPIFGPSEYVLELCGSRIGFVREADGGKVAVFPGAADPGKVVGSTTHHLDSGTGASEEWIRLTVRRDSSAGKWDLYVNGRPVMADIAIGSGAEDFKIHGREDGNLYVDDYGVDAENPLFADGDQDGMPDAEEKANGLNAFSNDRNGDLDGDGITNVNEIFDGGSPQAPGGTGAPSILYVDNLAGNDANTGGRSYVAIGNDGPKASIKAAMAAAPGGSTVVVLKGKGSYEEGSRGISGKPLTITTVEPVTIE